MNTTPVPGPPRTDLVRRPGAAAEVWHHSSHTRGHHTTNVFIVGGVPGQTQTRDAHTRTITPDGDEQNFVPGFEYGAPAGGYDYGPAYDYPPDSPGQHAHPHSGPYPPSGTDDGWIDVAAKRHGPSRKVWLGIGAAVLSVAAVAALSIHWASDSGSDQSRPLAAPASSPVVVRSPSQVLLGIEELRNLLRPTNPSSPDDTGQLALTGSTDKMIGDTVEPAKCSGVWSPGSAEVYSMLPVRELRTDMYGSGAWTGPHVVETVALLPDSESARKAATSIAHGWSQCAGSTVDVLNLPPTSQTLTLAVAQPVMDAVSTLSWTQPDTQWSCQRAVTAEGNALIDVRSCGQHLSTSAKPIAERIAEHARAS